MALGYQGTWQFLSVGMLTENPKTVEIPDDLESYLHVLLYFAVRYIRSNCKDPAGFIENYFDSYTYSDGVYTCGARKQHVIQVAGRLETGHGVPLIFDSPIDDIFARLLPLFKAHYKVQKYLRAKQKPAVTVPSTTCPLPVRSPALEPLRNSSKLAALREQMANELERFRHRTYRDDAPTAQEEKKARQVSPGAVSVDDFEVVPLEKEPSLAAKEKEVVVTSTAQSVDKHPPPVPSTSQPVKLKDLFAPREEEGTYNHYVIEREVTRNSLFDRLFSPWTSRS